MSRVSSLWHVPNLQLKHKLPADPKEFKQYLFPTQSLDSKLVHTGSHALVQAQHVTKVGWRGARQDGGQFTLQRNGVPTVIPHAPLLQLLWRVLLRGIGGLQQRVQALHKRTNTTLVHSRRCKWHP